MERVQKSRLAYLTLKEFFKVKLVMKTWELSFMISIFYSFLCSFKSRSSQFSWEGIHIFDSGKGKSIKHLANLTLKSFSKVISDNHVFIFQNLDLGRTLLVTLTFTFIINSRLWFKVIAKLNWFLKSEAHILSAHFFRYLSFQYFRVFSVVSSFYYSKVVKVHKMFGNFSFLVLFSNYFDEIFGF